MKDKIIDLTHVITDKMPFYPGDTGTSLLHYMNFQTHGYNNYKLETGMHTGTHIDTPMHLGKSNEYISNYPINKFIGIGCLLDVRGMSTIKMRPEFMNAIRENSIVLFYTGHDSFYHTNSYYDNYPCINIDLCEYLIEKKVKMIGIDSPSPDRYPFEIHNKLFENEIFIIENMTNLHQLVGIPEFEITALPLKIEADSSIVRVFARIRESKRHKIANIRNKCRYNIPLKKFVFFANFFKE
jgi:kynurenine formamidase